MKVTETSFAVIRARSLVLFGLFACIVGLIFGAILRRAWMSDLPFDRTFLALEGVLIDGILMLLVAGLLARAGLAPEAMVGPDPSWETLRRFTLLPFPLMVFSTASSYLLHIPLSYVAPGFVERFVLDNPPLMLCSGGADSVLLNLMTFFSVVVFGPMIEELVFRGILLTRWTLKWNVSSGILASSAVFGVLHSDVIGAFFIGCVLCLVYIETKSLFVPIVVHMTYNGTVWIFTGVEFLFGDPDAKLTLAELQSDWSLGMVAGVVIAPWVIWFLKNRFRRTDWRVPYLDLQRSANSVRADSLGGPTAAMSVI